MTSERTGRDLEPPVFSSAARAREQRSGRPRALRAAEREDASDRAGTRSSLAGVGSEPYPSIENRYFDCTKEWLERSLLLLLFPVWLALFLGIYCALYFPNRGQVLFTQPRVGKSGRRFAVFKFRTLRSGVVHPLVKPIQPDPGQHLFLGGWLRKTGLDELPQFLNILKGDMHVVGPRPFVRRDLAHLSSEESRQRHIVRPGLTGLWQVTRRYDESDIDFLDVDREYIRSASLWLDLCIICRTVRYVLKLRGR